MAKSIADIKNLYKSLKKSRIVLNWGEFANEINYDRAYISRVVNGHEPLTEELLSVINSKFGTTNNAPRENKPKEVSLDGIVNKILQEQQEQDAKTKVLFETVANILSNTSGRSVSLIAAELKEAVSMTLKHGAQGKS